MGDEKIMPEGKYSQADHDLLIRLDTKMDRAASDIQTVDTKVSNVSHELGVMSDGLEVKIAAAVSGKADTTQMLQLKADAEKVHDDHEKRIRFIERYVWGGLAILAVGQFVIGAAIAFWK